MTKLEVFMVFVKVFANWRRQIFIEFMRDLRFESHFGHMVDDQQSMFSFRSTFSLEVRGNSWEVFNLKPSGNLKVIQGGSVFTLNESVQCSDNIRTDLHGFIELIINMKNLTNIIEQIQKSLKQIKELRDKKNSMNMQMQSLDQKQESQMIAFQKIEQKNHFFKSHEHLSQTEFRSLIQTKIKELQDKNLEFNIIQVENTQALDNLKQSIEEGNQKKNDVEEFLENLDIQIGSDPNLNELDEKYYDLLREKKEIQTQLDQQQKIIDDLNSNYKDFQIKKKQNLEQENELKVKNKQLQEEINEEESLFYQYKTQLDEESNDLTKIMNHIQKLIDKKRKNDPKSSLWNKNQKQESLFNQKMMEDLSYQNENQKKYYEDILSEIDQITLQIRQKNTEIDKYTIKQKIKQKIFNLQTQKKT